MRVIAGTLKGRHISETHGHHTHPMSEKIRGALFNALGDIEGLTVLDAFTGTGAVAIESVSRGSSQVVALDLDKDAYKTAAANVENLKLNEKIEVLRINAKSWSNRNLDKLFDIVIADAPFDEVNDVLLEKVARHVRPQGLLI